MTRERRTPRPGSRHAFGGESAEWSPVSRRIIQDAWLLLVTAEASRARASRAFEEALSLIPIAIEAPEITPREDGKRGYQCSFRIPLRTKDCAEAMFWLASALSALAPALVWVGPYAGETRRFLASGFAVAEAVRVKRIEHLGFQVEG